MPAVIAVIVLIVSFALAWRALSELEAPKNLHKTASRVKKWSTILFLKGREVFYK